MSRNSSMGRRQRSTREVLKAGFLAWLLIAGMFASLSGQVSVTVNVDNKLHTIHPMVQGMGIIYSFEADSLYADGRVAQAYKDAGLSFLRWPGGAPTGFYHWDDLNGMGWLDTWNPNYDDSSDRPVSEFMDLDEYLDLCEAAGTEPMVGINMSSGMEWDREADGLNEAVRLIKHCLSRGVALRYVYLDNESYHTGNSYNKDPDNDGEKWTAQLYGEKVNLYADSIRKYLPDVKLIPNWKNNITSGNASLKTLVNTCGSAIDYIDIHWYWQWGDATWDLWIAKSPMEFETEWYNGGTYMEEIAAFNDLMKELGQPHIKVASLEWNFGPGPWREDPDHTKFKSALMQAEMQMQMMLGGIEVAALWAAHWPGTEDSWDRFLLDPDEGLTPNPVAEVYGLFKHAIGGTLLESVSSDNFLLPFIVEQQDGTVLIYLINKNSMPGSLNVMLQDASRYTLTESVCFQSPGEVTPISAVVSASSVSLFAPAYSLTMLELSKSTGGVEPRGGSTPAINIFPNPSNTDQITMEVMGYSGNFSYQVFNMMGMPATDRITSYREEGRTILSLDGLDAGSYYIQLFNASSEPTFGKWFIRI